MNNWKYTRCLIYWTRSVFISEETQDQPGSPVKETALFLPQSLGNVLFVGLSEVMPNCLNTCWKLDWFGGCPGVLMIECGHFTTHLARLMPDKARYGLVPGPGGCVGGVLAWELAPDISPKCIWSNAPDSMIRNTSSSKNVPCSGGN